MSNVRGGDERVMVNEEWGERKVGRVREENASYENLIALLYIKQYG